MPAWIHCTVIVSSPYQKDFKSLESVESSFTYLFRSMLPKGLSWPKALLEIKFIMILFPHFSLLLGLLCALRLIYSAGLKPSAVLSASAILSQ